MKRFMTEYANYKINSLRSNDLMRDEFKNEKISLVDKVIHLAKNGLITIDEAMNAISEA